MNFLPSNYAIKKSTVVFILITLTIFIGLSSYNNLPREWSPDIQIPILIVSTPYLGAAPTDIETTITRKLENEFNGIEGLKKLTSNSVYGASIVTLEFDIGTDLAEKRNKVREALDKVTPELPDDSEDTTITEINLSERPILTLSIAGSNNLVFLRERAEELQEDIESVGGILEVKVSGGYQREVQIDVDPYKLQSYNLSINKVIQTIRNENKNIPNGNITIESFDYSVRVLGEIQALQDIETMILVANNDSIIYIRDVAKVTFGYKKQTTRSRANRKESVSLAITKRSGENIVSVTGEVKEILQEFEKKYPQLTITFLSDRSVEVQRNVSDLENNIYSGIFFVVVALFLFLGVRNAFLVGIAIPLSMLMTFTILSFLSIELNFIVLFALILSLGMLVDNAIVVVENIYRHVQSGKTRVEAAMTGIGEVAYPVISSTLTTLAAFIPLLFMPGIIGEFMQYIPLTLLITLSSSLFVALFFNTVICSKMIGKPKNVQHISDIEFIQKSYVLNLFRSFLMLCIRWRWLVIIATITAWFLSIIVFAQSGLGTEFFPQGEPEEAVINIEAPDGITINEADKLVQKAENDALQFEDQTKSIVANIGSQRGGGETSNSGPSNSHILISFLRWEQWQELPSQIVKKLRNIIGNVAGAKIILTRSSDGPPTGKPVNIEINGPNLENLKQISQNIQQKISGIEGIVNLEDDLELRKPEIRVILDREKLARLGLNTSQVGGIIRTAISGTEASVYRIDDEEYDIIVRLDETYKRNIEDLNKLNFVMNSGNSITLTEIASIERGPAYGSIRHTNKKRVVTISADADEGYSGTNILKAVQQQLQDFPLPTGYNLQYTGENEDRQESQAYLIQSFVIAIFLIFVILVSQFNSLIYPLLILISVFLSLMGVFTGLIIHQRPFSIILGGIGTVSLAGIVVNNSIVLIDYINQLRQRGLELVEAVVIASMTRLRPILLTALTTIISLLPVVWGIDINFYRFPEVLKLGSSSGEFWLPMSFAVIYGLGISTILTLIILPILYIIIENTKNNMSKIFQFIFKRKKLATA